MTSTFVNNPLKTLSAAGIVEKQEPKTLMRKYKQYETQDGKAYFVEVDTSISVWELPEDGELVK